MLRFKISKYLTVSTQPWGKLKLWVAKDLFFWNYLSLLKLKQDKGLSLVNPSRPYKFIQNVVAICMSKKLLELSKHLSYVVVDGVVLIVIYW